MQPTIHDVNSTLVESVGELAIKRTQFLPDDFFDELNDARFDSVHTPAGNLHRVASVPVWLVEKWKFEGYDVYTAPVEETVKRLKLEAYDKFLASKKRI